MCHTLFSWSVALGDEELYDYKRDRWETTNFAAAANYSKIKAELRAVLLKQYLSGDSGTDFES
jgi:hypothetical protein